VSERNPVLDLQTEDGVRFSLPLAGPIVRLLAWTIDALAVASVTTFLSRLVAVVALVSDDLAFGVRALVFFVVFEGYSIALEWRLRGQTIGKRLFGLRVVDAEGLHLRLSQVVVRNLLRFADMLPLAYLVGGLACVFTEHAQRLGDLAAGTVVVRTRPATMRVPARVLAGAQNSLVEHPRLVARLRRHVSSEEAMIALNALLRRDRLDPAPRVSLFAELANHFRALVRFPEEATRGQSDERLVQNVAAVLFEPGAAVRHETARDAP
jgi:uncharacterized RDD family membrane protein YckC